MAESSLCCLEARRQSICGLGWGCSTVFESHRPLGCTRRVLCVCWRLSPRWLCLYGYYPDAYTMALLTSQVEAVLGTHPSRVAFALWPVTFTTTM